MAPVAVTPPVVEVKSFASTIQPRIKRVDTANLGTKRNLLFQYVLHGAQCQCRHLTQSWQISMAQFLCKIPDIPCSITLDADLIAAPSLQSKWSPASAPSAKCPMNSMLPSVPFEDGFEVMKNVLEIDPDFQSFHEFCINNDIPFNVISASLKPVLR